MMMSSSPQAPLNFYKRRNKVLRQAYLSSGFDHIIPICIGGMEVPVPMSMESMTVEVSSGLTYYVR